MEVKRHRAEWCVASMVCQGHVRAKRFVGMEVNSEQRKWRKDHVWMRLLCLDLMIRCRPEKKRHRQEHWEHVENEFLLGGR